VFGDDWLPGLRWSELADVCLYAGSGPQFAVRW
jgi:hypothetical protein